MSTAMHFNSTRSHALSSSISCYNLFICLKHIHARPCSILLWHFLLCHTIVKISIRNLIWLTFDAFVYNYYFYVCWYCNCIAKKKSRMHDASVVCWDAPYRIIIFFFSFLFHFTLICWRAFIMHNVLEEKVSSCVQCSCCKL